MKASGTGNTFIFARAGLSQWMSSCLSDITAWPFDPVSCVVAKIGRPISVAVLKDVLSPSSHWSMFFEMKVDPICVHREVSSNCRAFGTWPKLWSVSNEMAIAATLISMVKERPREHINTNPMRAINRFIIAPQAEKNIQKCFLSLLVLRSWIKNKWNIFSRKRYESIIDWFVWEISRTKEGRRGHVYCKYLVWLLEFDSATAMQRVTL